MRPKRDVGVRSLGGVRPTPRRIGNGGCAKGGNSGGGGPVWKAYEPSDAGKAGQETWRAARNDHAPPHRACRKRDYRLARSNQRAAPAASHADKSGSLLGCRSAWRSRGGEVGADRPSSEPDEP